jgi:hypothetical protein
MAKKLTSRAIETLKPGTVRREIPDGLLAGLYLIVQPSGAKSWAIRYRFKGNPRKFTLGSWPVVDLAGARELGQKALIAAKRGDDPGAQKKAERRAAGAAERDDFAEIALEFIERYARPNTREATWRETARSLGFEVDPENPKLLRPTPTGGEVCKWRGKTVHEIARRDVLDLLDRIVDRGSPVTANRTLAAIGRLFSWCIERDILRASPCAGVKPPTSERSRDRVLADDEIRAVWQACDKVGWPFAPIVKLSILTAQRRDEVAEMPKCDGRKSTSKPERGRLHASASRTIKPMLCRCLTPQSKCWNLFPASGLMPASSSQPRAVRRFQALAGPSSGSTSPSPN